MIIVHRLVALVVAAVVSSKKSWAWSRRCQQNVVDNQRVDALDRLGELLCRLSGAAFMPG